MASTNIQQLTLEEEAGMCALQLGSSYVLPFTLEAAIKLRLLDIFVKAGPSTMLSQVDIAAQLSTKNPQAATMVDQMLRLLAANSVISCTIQTIADGCPSRKYVHIPMKAAYQGVQRMTSHTNKNLFRVYSGFNEMEVLVDVNGIDGTSLQMITSRHRHIKGINYNLPHIISGYSEQRFSCLLITGRPTLIDIINWKV
ncbi:unnamed protein product [Musa acuminata subsp. burmannicoides]